MQFTTDVNSNLEHDNKEEFLDFIDDWIYDTDKMLGLYISLLHTRYYQTNPDKSKIRNELKTFLK